MDEELKSEIEKLNDNIRKLTKVSEQQLAYQHSVIRRASAAGTVAAVARHERSKNAISLIREDIDDSGQREVARADRSGGTNFNRSITPRIATPDAGGFRAYFGLGFFQKLESLIENVIMTGVRSGISKTFDGSFVSTIKSILKKTTVSDPEVKDTIKDLYIKAETKKFQDIQARPERIKEFENEWNRITQELKSKTQSLPKIKDLTESISVGPKTKTAGIIEEINKAFAKEDLKALEENMQELTGLSKNLRGDLRKNVDDLVEGLQNYIPAVKTNISDANQQRAKLTEGMAIEMVNRSKLAQSVILAGKVVGLLIGAITAVTAVVNSFRNKLIETSQQLGGVGLGKSFTERVSATFESLSRILPGGEAYVRGQEILQTKGTFAQEFGGLLTTDAAAELAEFATKMGLTTDQLISLERTFQGTTMNVEDALDRFREVGLGSGIAAQELAQNADIIARAGDDFNSFIVEGIANAKRLGLEFRQIEQTLTGFSMDFEGTVESFAQTRALIPGLATDFSELMYTSLYGSTNDFVELIRSDLLGAGITSTTGMSRPQLASLQQTYGFTADQIDRILKNEDVNFDVQKNLDTNRNQLLKYIVMGIGALIGGVAGLMLVTGAGLAVISGGVSAVLAAAASATLVGGMALAGGYVGGKLVEGTTGDDIVSKPGYGERTLVTPQGMVPLNNQDTILAYADDMASTPDSGVDFYQKGELAPTTQEVNIDLSGLERTLKEIHMTLQRNKKVEITGIDTGLESLQQRTIRNY